MRFYVVAGILVLAGSACTDNLTGPDPAAEPVVGTAAFVVGMPPMAAGGVRPECIHVARDGPPDFTCGHNEPDSLEDPRSSK